MTDQSDRFESDSISNWRKSSFQDNNPDSQSSQGQSNSYNNIPGRRFSTKATVDSNSSSFRDLRGGMSNLINIGKLAMRAGSGSSVPVGQPRMLAVCSVVAPGDAGIVSEKDDSVKEIPPFLRLRNFVATLKPTFATREVCAPGDLRNLKWVNPSINMIDSAIKDAQRSNRRLGLSNGFDKYIKRDEEVDEKLDHLIIGLAHAMVIASRSHPTHFVSPNIGTDKDQITTKSLNAGIHKFLQAEKIGFSCFRGQLTKIMLAPLADKDPVEIYAVKHKGVIYLCKKKTDSFGDREDISSQKSMFAGYKFEDVITEPAHLPSNNNAICDIESSSSSKPLFDLLTERIDTRIVNTNEELLMLSRLAVGNHRLAVGAEIDGFLPRGDCSKKLANVPTDSGSDNVMDPTIKFVNLCNKGLISKVEMKTHKLINSERDMSSFHRFKLRNSWAQCYVPGVDKIVIGFRDPKTLELGVVEEYNTTGVPKMLKEIYNGHNGGGRLSWNAEACVGFLNATLDFLAANVRKEDVIYLLSSEQGIAKPNRDRQAFGRNKGNEPEFVLYECEPNSVENFLPPWFTE